MQATQCLQGTAAAELPRLGFVHVPKTAGTSVTSALLRAYAGQVFPAMTTLDYRGHDAASLAAYRLFKGHAYRCDYARLPDDTTLFTILRDPVDRALSVYRYYRAMQDSHLTDRFILEASRLAKTQSAIEFIYSDSPFVIEHLRLGQVRQFLPAALLTDIGHRQFLSRELRREAVASFTQELTKFAYALTYEMLALSFPAMIAALDLPDSCGALAHENGSDTADDCDPADVRRALIDINAAEFVCYDHVRRRETAWLLKTLCHNRTANVARPLQSCAA